MRYFALFDFSFLLILLQVDILMVKLILVAIGSFNVAIISRKLIFLLLPRVFFAVKIKLHVDISGINSIEFELCKRAIERATGIEEI